jgi:hypothetical protein
MQINQVTCLSSEHSATLNQFSLLSLVLFSLYPHEAPSPPKFKHNVYTDGSFSRNSYYFTKFSSHTARTPTDINFHRTSLLNQMQYRLCLINFSCIYEARSMAARELGKKHVGAGWRDRGPVCLLKAVGQSINWTLDLLPAAELDKHLTQCLMPFVTAFYLAS